MFQPRQGTKAAISVWSQTEDLDAIIGPSCSKSCLTVALIADAWLIPVISYGCYSDALSDPKQYPNFARSVGTTQLVALIANHITEYFGWETIGIISSKSSVHLSMARNHKKLHSQSGKQVFFFSATSTLTSSDQNKELERMRQILRLMKMKCRIIFAYMYPLNVRDMLALAQEEDMLEGKICSL